MNKKKLTITLTVFLVLATVVTFLLTKGGFTKNTDLTPKNSLVNKDDSLFKANDKLNKESPYKGDPLLEKIAKVRYDELKTFISDLSLDRVYRHLNSKPKALKYRHTSDLYFYCRALTDIFSVDKAKYSQENNNFALTNGNKDFFTEFEQYYVYKPFTFNIPYLVNLVEQTAAVGLLYQVKTAEQNFTEGKEESNILKLPFNYLYLNLPNTHYLYFDGPSLPFKQEKSKDNKLVNVYSESFPNVGTLLMLNFSSKPIGAMTTYSPFTMFKEGDSCVIIMTANNDSNIKKK